MSALGAISEAREGGRPAERPEDEPGDDGGVGPSGVMHPDHPLLQRAQDALKRQLQESQLRLEGELREKGKMLADAKAKRETVGVELFGFQQQLAKLQMELERAHERHADIAAMKEAADARLGSLKAEHAKEAALTKDERVRADKFQEELDRCGGRGALRRPASQCRSWVGTEGSVLVTSPLQVKSFLAQQPA